MLDGTQKEERPAGKDTKRERYQSNDDELFIEFKHGTISLVSESTRSIEVAYGD